MNYPFWDVGIGYGLLMAGIAVVHVFVSHFAIGGGLYLVVAETRARKRNDKLMLEFLRKLSKFFVLVTVVFGALTGVGIWFIIGLLNPTATEALIHNFVWGWATEWTFFAIEITAVLLYFYGWDRMTARAHVIVGWIYFGAAWMSLFVINGIITFMLTPGDWLVTGSFWDGFFNPTFWSSLWLRTGVCIMLAGLYALVIASRYKADDFKKVLVRYNARWALAGLVVMVPTFYWYWKSIPAAITSTALEMMPTPIASLTGSFWNAGLIAVALLLFGLIIPKKYNIVVAIIVMGFGLSWFAEYEWMRESIRKPYVISGHMYGNALEVARADIYAEEGYLSWIVFRTGDDGADLFRRACRSCHTVGGYKALEPAFDGTDRDFIAAIVRGTGVIKGNMPPFMGTQEEAELIAAHIHARLDNRHLGEIYGLGGVELGRKVYRVRCGGCHEIGGYNDKWESLAGLTADDLGGILDMAGEFGDEMPDFTGDETERQALVEYLLSLNEGGTR
ncbi:MAG: c-type cytochrome [Candidatus Zixiibacteriota bacterium]|nr:MAG: c-type cytochrome [candidate division Zixibacteria bacterium]